jgi:hypothetical protein
MARYVSDASFALIDRTVIEHERGISSCKRGWKSHLYALALLFHEPKIRESLFSTNIRA